MQENRLLMGGVYMLDMIASQTSIPSQTKSNEWYTPSKYIEAAREVMGSIDLDPASCELANQTVKASRYYTKEDDGLSQEWRGNVWLNPPFSTKASLRGMEPGRIQGSIIKLWINRVIAEYRQGNVSEAMLLTKTDMKANWFNALWEFPICFARDHLYFDRPGLAPEKHFFGTCFVYLGFNEQKFIEVFSQFGTIAKRVNPAPVKPSMCELWEVE